MLWTDLEVYCDTEQDLATAKLAIGHLLDSLVRAGLEVSWCWPSEEKHDE